MLERSTHESAGFVGSLQVVQAKHLIAGIHHGAHAFRKHGERVTLILGGSDEFGNGDQAGDSYQDAIRWPFWMLPGSFTGASPFS